MFKGSGTLMTSLYKDYALKLGYLTFELAFPNLNSSKIAFPGWIFVI